jgi:hypothetical protein
MANVSEFSIVTYLQTGALARGHFPQGADWEGRWRDGG